jgi:hypothetical protein
MPALSSEACKVIGTRVLMTFVMMKLTRRESSLLQAPLRRRKRGMLCATVSPSSARRLLCQVPTPATQVREHARGR